MGTSYIAENKVFTACTFQLDSEPKKLIHSRSNLTVFYKGNTEYPLLTMNDKNLDKPFICKSPANLAGALLAFGAGLIVGALLLSNPLGWVAIGVMATGVIIAGAGVVAAVATINHKCTDPLNGGKWELTHDSVRFDQSIAITRSSILKCGSGGVLIPFFSYSAAKQAAENIASNNRKELGLNIVGSFFAGVTLPSALAGITGVSAGAMFVGKMRSGYVAFSILAWGEKAGIRGYNENIGGLKDNKTYENMNSVDGNDLFSLPNKPDDVVQDGSDLIGISKDGDGKIGVDALSKISGAYAGGKIIIHNIQLQNQLKQIQGLTKQTLRTNPIAQQLLTDLNSDKYPKWKENIQNYNNKRMNPSMVQDGRNTSAQSFKNGLKDVGNGILFLLPFAVTWFSEKGRSALAEAMVVDMANSGLHVTANNPLD